MHSLRYFTVVKFITFSRKGSVLIVLAVSHFRTNPLWAFPELVTLSSVE